MKQIFMSLTERAVSVLPAETSVATVRLTCRRKTCFLPNLLPKLRLLKLVNLATPVICKYVLMIMYDQTM
jgi:hypothetical protein